MPAIPIIYGGLSTGLTLTASVYSGDALAGTVAMTETPAGSGRYVGSFDAPAAAAMYDVIVRDADGKVYSLGGSFVVDATGAEITIAAIPTNPLLATDERLDAMKAKTDLIATNDADSPRVIQAALDAAEAAGNSDVNGNGIVLVNQDYGGTDSLRIKNADGSWANGAQIRAYVKSDYDSGTIAARPPYAKTDSDGRFPSGLNLNPDTYYLQVFNPLDNLSKLFTVVVTAP